MGLRRAFVADRRWKKHSMLSDLLEKKEPPLKSIDSSLRLNDVFT